MHEMKRSIKELYEEFKVSGQEEVEELE